MKQDRFLTGILIGIGLLVVVALTVFFTRADTQAYVSDDVPEGVVHNYVLAVLNKDYEKAYGYLAELENKPTFDEFRRAYLNGEVNPNDQAVDIGDSEIFGDTASVNLDLIYNSSDPFSSGYRNTQTAQLLEQNGAWKLTFMPEYYFWGYNWYMEE
jgi:hypothetical protein